MNYMFDLTETLSGDELSALQVIDLGNLGAEIETRWPKGLIGPTEILAMHGLARLHGLPKGGYRPEVTDPAGPDRLTPSRAQALGFPIPSDADVRRLLGRIRMACCRE